MASPGRGPHAGDAKEELLMTSREILYALQSGKISLDDAKEKFMRMKAEREHATTPDASAASEKYASEAPCASRHGNGASAPEIRGLSQEGPSAGKGYLCESPDHAESIAIIGMAGRYPGAEGLDQYWLNLTHAKNSVREIPGSRWNVHDYYDSPHPGKGKINSKWIGLLDAIEYFDPGFFNISAWRL